MPRLSFMPKYITPIEAADLLRVSVKTLERWRCMGQGPEYIKINIRVRYLEGRLHEWLNLHSRI